MLRAMRPSTLLAILTSPLAVLALAWGARGDDLRQPLDPSDAGQAEEDASDRDVADASDAGEDALVAAADPTTATATDPNDTGFAFGLRGGVAFPFGRVNGRPIQDVITNSVPVTVDVGVFVTAHLYLGVLGMFGFVAASSADTTTCPSNAGCTARRWRFGALAAWHFRPRSVINPYVGIGIAYDLVNLTATDTKTGDVVQSSALQGFEFVNVTTGIEIRPKPFWGFGPYVDGSAGIYAPSFNIHGWLGGGLRFFSIL